MTTETPRIGEALTTIYFSYAEWYPVIDLAPIGVKDSGEQTEQYYRIGTELHSHMARVPRRVARNYAAAVRSYHAADKALNEAIGKYYKEKP